MFETQPDPPDIEHWREVGFSMFDRVAEHREELARRYPGRKIEPWMSGAAPYIETFAQAVAFLEILEGTGSFTDRAWVDSKYRAAGEWWLQNTDPVVEQGWRNVYRKWRQTWKRMA